MMGKLSFLTDGTLVVALREDAFLSFSMISTGLLLLPSIIEKSLNNKFVRIKVL